MPQHRLEHYFTPFCTPVQISGLSFLDLPQTVRYVVYNYVGLGNAFVDLNYTNLLVYQKGTYPETRDCVKLHAFDECFLRKLDVNTLTEVWEIEMSSGNNGLGVSPWNRPYGLHQSLLLVSKRIHREVEAYTYARAVLRVCLGQPLGFQRLWALSQNAISHLTSLTIRLDVPKALVLNETWAHSASPEYLDSSTNLGKMTLKYWQRTLEQLARTIAPGRLRLRVVFRAISVSDARVFVEPMVKLPLLKDCGICVEIVGEKCVWKENWDGYNAIYRWKTGLAPTMYLPLKNADTELSRMVQQINQKLTSVPEPGPEAFRYLDLSRELRFNILRFTQLVSPDAVQWRPHRVLTVPSPCTWCTFRYREWKRGGESRCTCSSSLEEIAGDWEHYICNRDCRLNDHTGICYCSTKGQVWSTSCREYRRHSLFSVSSQVRQDALQVYYALNQILVIPYNSSRIRSAKTNSWLPLGWPDLPKVELSLYLSTITRNALRIIRRFGWILPGLQRSYLFPGTPAWSDYLKTLQLMEDEMNLSALTFTVDMSISGLGSDDSRDFSDENAFEWQQKILLPMRQLGRAGLKDFLVHLGYPYVNDRVVRSYERKLERLVMGAEYNSAEREKSSNEGLSRVYDDLRRRYG